MEIELQLANVQKELEGIESSSDTINSIIESVESMKKYMKLNLSLKMKTFTVDMY